LLALPRTIRLHQRSGDHALRERFERELNEEQRAAATAPDGYNLILAGPGSGKTRVITYRVAYLIARGVPAESILLVTFTRRAAREMLVRLDGLIGPKAHRVWAGTFHHIGNRVVRRSAKLLGLDANFSILDSEDANGLMKLAMEDVGLVGKGAPAGAPKPALVSRLISFAFNTQQSLAQVVTAQRTEYLGLIEMLEGASVAFAERKRSVNCVDYDDLLGHWRKILSIPEQRESHGRLFSHVLVDELQDTNIVQMEIVEEIARAGAGNLTGVGDDAQAIYRFRGAHYDNMLKFPERNARTQLFRLESNYRSTPEIVDFVNAVIAPSASGFSKTLISTRTSAQKPQVIPAGDGFEEAQATVELVREGMEEGVSLNEMAVLYRNSFDSALLEEELVRARIPYEVRGGPRFFEKAHIKDALSYLRILVNPRDQLAWDRLLQMLEGVGGATSAKIRGAILSKEEPLKAVESSEVMSTVPPKARGAFATFVADLRAIRVAASDQSPSEGVSAILKSHYPEFARRKYVDQGLSPENRLAEIEQLGVLASRYSNLEEFLSDLVLAGDLYGQDSANEEPADQLVLSTIHQAKGLEWSRVFIIRCVDGIFPNERSLREPGGEDEERRIFYVAASRAKDELYLSYPLTTFRPGVGQVLSRPSRFLTLLDRDLYEEARIVSDADLAWTEGYHRRDH
jgi:ATP-dependent DNA helicase UvrD/PcrA